MIVSGPRHVTQHLDFESSHISRLLWIHNEQVGCSVVGVASPAGRFTGLICSLGVTLLRKV